MNILQWILLPLGSSLRHKTLDSIFSGISYSTLGLLIMTTVLSLSSEDTLVAIMLKMSALIHLQTCCRTRNRLKKISEDLYGMFDAILVFEGNKTPKERLKFGFSLIPFLSCFMSCCVIGIYISVTNQEFNKLCDQPSSSRLDCPGLEWFVQRPGQGSGWTLKCPGLIKLAQIVSKKVQ